MDSWTYAALAASLAATLLLAERLRASFLTVPAACLLLGLAFGLLGAVPEGVDEHGLERVAEAALAVVLFADGCQARPADLLARPRLAGRLLVLGMPIALLLGTAAFAILFPSWPLWDVALLAALLVPTDAALSHDVVEGEALPSELRSTLRVESGLNDGLALPLIIFLACGAIGFEHDLQRESWLLEALRQVGLGVGVGVVVGGAAGLLAHVAQRDGAPETHGAACLVVVAAAYFGADALGGNAFVAVFLAGAAFAVAAPASNEASHGFLTTASGGLAAVAFVYAGAALLPDALARLSPVSLAVVVLGLGIVRPAAAWIALAGTGTTPRTRLLLGWFGPRGLATALFAVFALERFAGVRRADDILAITTLTVLASALLHGASAIAFAARLPARGRPCRAGPDHPPL